MTAPHLGRLARWGWLATTCAMGAALLAAAWLGRQRVAAAASTLNRGQGEVLLESARQGVRGLTLPVPVAALDSLLARQESAGLRYVAGRPASMRWAAGRSRRCSSSAAGSA
jgi:hypothetical protein